MPSAILFSFGPRGLFYLGGGGGWGWGGSRMDISSLLNPVKGSNGLDHLQDRPNDAGRNTSRSYAHTSSPGLLAVEVGKPDSPSQPSQPSHFIHPDRSGAGCIHQTIRLKIDGDQDMPNLKYDDKPITSSSVSTLRSSLEVPARPGSPAQSLP